MNVYCQSPPENANNPENSVRFQPFTPLKAASSTLPLFPVNLLPPVLRNMVEAVAAHTQTVPDMAAAIGLGVLAVCLQGKVRVEGNYGHYEQLSLYELIIAPPGERKSSVIRAMTSVIEDYEQDYNEKRKPEIRHNRIEREELQRRINGLTKQFEQKPDSMAELELEHLQDNLAELPVLKPARFFADDCTSESLTRLLAENDGRMAVISAESGVFDTITGRYATKPNVDVWLKGICGDTIRVDRMNRDPEYIRHPALSAVLTAQPSVLSEIMENGLLDGRGFLARFLYVNITRSPERAFRSQPIPEEIVSDYRELIYRLMELPDEDCLTLRLSEEAVEGFTRYYAGIEHYLATEGRDLREWGSKLNGMVLRIAGLLHMAEGKEGEISEETMRSAMMIGRYALAHVKQPISAEHLRFVVGGQEEQDEEKKYNKTDHTDPNKKRGPQL